MNPEEIFGSIITFSIGAVIIIALLGGDPKNLIQILPDILVFALVLALIVGFLRMAID